MPHRDVMMFGMSNEPEDAPTATEWCEHVIGLISGSEFDGGREIRLKMTGSGKAYAACFIGPFSKVEYFAGTMLLSPEDSELADRLLEGLRAELPDHTIRAHSSPPPSEVRPIPHGHGEWGVFLSDEGKERMWAQSLDFVSLCVMRRGFMTVNHDRLHEALASGNALNIDIARNAVISDKAEYRSYLAALSEQVDLLQAFVAAERAAGTTETSVASARP